MCNYFYFFTIIYYFISVLNLFFTIYFLFICLLFYFIYNWNILFICIIHLTTNFICIELRSPGLARKLHGENWKTGVGFGFIEIYILKNPRIYLAVKYFTMLIGRTAGSIEYAVIFHLSIIISHFVCIGGLGWWKRRKLWDYQVWQSRGFQECSTQARWFKTWWGACESWTGRRWGDNLKYYLLFITIFRIKILVRSFSFQQLVIISSLLCCAFQPSRRSRSRSRSRRRSYSRSPPRRKEGEASAAASGRSRFYILI